MAITTQDTIITHSSMVGHIPSRPIFRGQEQVVERGSTNDLSRSPYISRYNDLAYDVNNIQAIDGPELSGMSRGQDIGYFYDPFDEWSGARSCAAEAFQWCSSVPDTVS